MGVLTIGKPLTWSEINSNLQHYRERYLDNFINNYQLYKDNISHGQCFGDEIEYGIFTTNKHSRRVKISNNMTDLLNNINHHGDDDNRVVKSMNTWHPEYGDWMIEGVPLEPFKNINEGIYHLEQNLCLRRRELLSNLSLNEILIFYFI